jgi:hypothetical protein
VLRSMLWLKSQAILRCPLLQHRERVVIQAFDSTANAEGWPSLPKIVFRIKTPVQRLVFPVLKPGFTE